MKDGSIEIGIDIAIEKAEKSLQDLKDTSKDSAKEVQDNFDIDVQKMEQRFKQMQNDIQKTRDTMSGLTQEINRIEQAEQDLTEKGREINELYADRNQLLKDYREGQFEGTSDEYLEMYDEIRTKITEATEEAQRLQQVVAETGDKETLTGKLEQQQGILDKQVGRYEMLALRADELNGKMKGVDVTSKSIAKSTNEITKGLSGGVKKLIRYAGALFGIRTAYNFIRKISSEWLNGTTVEAQQARASIEAMTSMLSNALAPVIQWLIGLLSTLFGYFNAILKTFFGIELSAKKTAKSTGGIAKGTAKARKEAERFSASFDKAEVMSENIADNIGAGGGGGGDVAVETPTLDLDTTPFSRALERLKADLEPFISILKSIDLEPLRSSFDKLGKTSKKTFKIMYDSAKRTMNKSVAPFIKLLAEDLVPKGLNTVERILNRFNKVLDPLLKDFVEPLINWFLLDFAPVGLELVYSIIDGLSGIISVVVAGFTEFWDAVGKYVAWVGGELLKAIMEDLKIIIDEIVESIDYFLDQLEEGDPVAQALAFAIGLVTVALIAFKAAQLAVNGAVLAFNALQAVSPFTWVVLAIAAIIAIILVLYKNWDDIKEFFKETIDKIKNYFGELGDKIKEAFSNAWQSVKDTWQGVKDWFNERVIQPVVGFFTGMWDNLKTGASNAWQGIKDVFGSVASFFGDVFGKAWQKVKDIFSTGGQIFSGIKDGIAETFTRIVNKIIDGINKVVATPFNAINNALGRLRGVGILGMKPFGWLPNISVPQIPRLARGHYADSGSFQALIGESGKEAVVPLENNTSWARDFLSVLDDYGGMSSGVETVIAEINGRVLFEVLIQEERRKTMIMNGA